MKVRIGAAPPACLARPESPRRSAGRIPTTVVPTTDQESAAVPLVVQKFGGTSVATADRIRAAARRAIRAKQAGNQVVVVVSARGGTTDELIELAGEITDAPPAREMDMLLSTGEQISIALMAMAIHTLGEREIGR